MKCSSCGKRTWSRRKAIEDGWWGSKGKMLCGYCAPQKPGHIILPDIESPPEIDMHWEMVYLPHND